MNEFNSIFFVQICTCTNEVSAVSTTMPVSIEKVVLVSEKRKEKK